MKKLLRIAAALLLPAAVPPALAHDYPTVDRVLYVQDCMREHPGLHYEMLNKCACALDRIAGEVPHEDFVAMNTAANANSIGGERGNTIRDTELLQEQIRRWRKLQSAAKQSCFIRVEAAGR